MATSSEMPPTENQVVEAFEYRNKGARAASRPLSCSNVAYPQSPALYT